MTSVRFKFTKPTAVGLDIPIKGIIMLKPTRRYAVDGNPDRTVLPVAFSTEVPVTGTIEIKLAPTGPGWCWELLGHDFDGYIWREYFVVPDADSVEFTDLARVDPDSLDSLEEPDPLWWAEVKTLKDLVAQGGGSGPGSEGPEGPMGPEGPAGPPGKDGRDGRDGRDGIDGAPGKDGINGESGRDGIDGAPGRDGKDGADGLPGPEGPIGPEGPAGRDGIDGAPGKDGRDGIDGLPGPAGKDGERGPEGPAGKDGSSGSSDPNAPLHFKGEGFPNGVVEAPIGSYYTDTKTTRGAVRWIKASGTGSTGWKVEYGDTGPITIYSGWGVGYDTPPSGGFSVRRTAAGVSISAPNVGTIPASNGKTRTATLLNVPPEYAPDWGASSVKRWDWPLVSTADGSTLVMLHFYGAQIRVTNFNPDQEFSGGSFSIFYPVSNQTWPD